MSANAARIDADATTGRVVLVTTDGAGSMDVCGQRLAANLPIERLEDDIGRRSAELFGAPSLGPAAARALRADAAFVARLRRDPPDLWHFVNHHTARYGPLAGAPYVASVYDLIRQFDARDGGRLISRPNARDRLMLRLDAAGITRAAAVCAPSQATKRDLVQHLDVPAERVAVVPLGIDHALFRPLEGRPLDAPYVLYVGSEHPRKNLPTLIRAFASLRRDPRFAELRLVKVGDPGTAEAPFHTATRRAVDECGIAEQVVFAGRVPDAELPRWYSHAECMALPSLAEGFGLPIVEAMACGCPVVVSTSGSLPEIAGDAALAVAPSDVAGLRHAIATLASDAAARSELSARGRARAADFSWGRAARETALVHAATLGDLGIAPGEIEPDPRRVTSADPVAARVARARGGAVRAAYRAALRPIAARPVAVPRMLRCTVFAFSSRGDLPEQVASIRSFLATAGRPRAYTVVSDGSHDERARRLLGRVDPCVRVADLADVVRRDLPSSVHRYAQVDVMGSKLALELSLPTGEPVVYADADVLFLDGADELAGILEAGGPPRFLRDCEPYLDRRILTPQEASLMPVNGGFFMVFGPLDWSAALLRLDRVVEPVFHTEQTLLHLAMHASGGRALDREHYVVDTDDIGEWRDRHRGRSLALRHYTTPVRHKLWAAVAGG